MHFIKGDSLKDPIERFHQSNVSWDTGERALEFRKLWRRFLDVCNAIALRSHAELVTDDYSGCRPVDEGSCR